MLAQKIVDRDRKKDSVSFAQMILINKNGKKRVRQFRNSRLLENGLEKQIIRFTSPADIGKPGLETEQFLYLPAVKRTRRIVSSQKSNRFVNSDFTYEDMERHPVDDYTYKISGTKKVGSLECYSLEIFPKHGIKS